MCAIYAELEAGCLDRKIDNDIFRLAKIAHSEWSERSKKNQGIKTANDTIVYLKKKTIQILSMTILNLSKISEIEKA